jgi:hypothetical protein
MTRKKKTRPAITIGVTTIWDDEPSPEYRELMRNLLLNAAKRVADDAAKQTDVTQMSNDSLPEPHTQEDES